MGNVTSLTVFRAARAARARVEAARRHPALRYTAGDGYAHARDLNRTACGAGSAIAGMAATSDPACPVCFPPEPRR